MNKDSNPSIRQIAGQLENPFFLTLVKLIRLYTKFNKENKEFCNLID